MGSGSLNNIEMIIVVGTDSEKLSSVFFGEFSRLEFKGKLHLF